MSADLSELTLTVNAGPGIAELDKYEGATKRAAGGNALLEEAIAGRASVAAQAAAADARSAASIDGLRASMAEMRASIVQLAESQGLLAPSSGKIVTALSAQETALRKIALVQIAAAEADEQRTAIAVRNADRQAAAVLIASAAQEAAIRKQGLLELNAIAIDEQRTASAVSAAEKQAAATAAAALAEEAALRKRALLELDAIGMDDARTASAISAAEKQTAAMAAAAVKQEATIRSMALLEIEAHKLNAEFDTTNSVTGRLSKNFDAMTIAMGAFAIAAVVLHKFATETISAQDAQAQLEAAVQSTGGAAGRSVDQLQDMATQLQNVSTFSDEAVQGAETVLLSFNKIRDVQFDRATKDVVDLAARMGGDLPGAALKLGKALQDPAEGLSALQKMGIRFSDAQKLVIQNLDTTGQRAAAQNLILAEVEKRFGGAAVAARDTLGGALKGLQNSFGDLFEIGNKNSQGLTDSINRLSNAFEHLNDSISGGTFIADVIRGFSRMIELIDGAATAFGDLAAVANGTGLLINGVLTHNTDNFKKGVQEIQEAVAELAKTGEHLHDVLSQPAPPLLAQMLNANGPLVRFGAGGKDDAVPTPDYDKARASAQLLIDKQNALNAVFGQQQHILDDVNAKFDLSAKILAIHGEYTGKDTDHTRAQGEELIRLATRLDAVTKASRDLAREEQLRHDQANALFAEQATAQSAKTNTGSTFAIGAGPTNTVQEHVDATDKLITKTVTLVGLQGTSNTILESQRKTLQGLIVDDATREARTQIFLAAQGAAGIAQNQLTKEQIALKERLAQIEIDNIGSYADGIARIIDSAGGLLSVFTNISRELLNAVHAAAQLADNVSKAQRAGIHGEVQADGSVVQKNAGFLGALSGKAGIGGVVAGVSSVIGIAGAAAQLADAVDLFGTHAKQAREEYEKQVTAFDASVRSIRNLVDGVTTFAQSLDAVRDQFQSLRDSIPKPDTSSAAAYAKSIGDTIGRTIELNALEKERIAQLTKEHDALLALAGQSLDVRALRASGDTTGADALQRTLDHLAEIKDAEDKLGVGDDSPYIVRLKEVQVAEDKAADAAKALAAAVALADITGSNDVLELRTKGLGAEADALQTSMDIQSKYEDALAKYGDTAEVARYKTLLLADAEKQLQDQRDAEAKRLGRSLFDTTNATQAFGDVRGATESAFMENLRRQVEDATTAEEKMAASTYAAAAAADFFAKRLESDTRTSEGLASRVLTALGGGRQAEDITRGFANRQANVDLANSGASQFNIDFQKFTQAAEGIAIDVSRAIEDDSKRINDQAKADTAENVRIGEEYQARADKQIQLLEDDYKLQSDKFDGLITVAQQQVTYAQQALQAAQSQLALTQKAVDSLASVNDTLKLSDLSTLSPSQKLAETKAQFDALVSAAQGGDRNAAAGVGNAANAYLTQDRAYNGTSAAYGNDFASVQQIIAGLTSQYNGLLGQDTGAVSSAQGALDAANVQVGLLNDLKTATLQGIKDRESVISADAQLFAKSITDANQVIADSIAIQIDQATKADQAAGVQRIHELAFYDQFAGFIANGAGIQFDTSTPLNVVLPSTTDTSLRDQLAELRTQNKTLSDQLAESKEQTSAIKSLFTALSDLTTKDSDNAQQIVDAITTASGKTVQKLATLAQRW